MTQLNSPVAILKLLDKSNCRECGYPTCLAFASAVFKGYKQLRGCPHLDRKTIDKYEDGDIKQFGAGQDPEALTMKLRKKLASIDLFSAAERLGAKYANNRLTIKVCGKDFSVDQEGNFYSEIHIHSWITGPLLGHIINGQGKPISGNWVSFRELKKGRDWHQFFIHQCEAPFKKIADTYTELFEDLLHIFNGKRVENHYQSDISLVLHPLPRLPLLICYWKPEDGLDSSLNLFFDSTADENLKIEFIYSLVTGLVKMFEKISLRHGYK